MGKQKYRNRNSGLTLIELIVTIGIIGILAGIGVVAISKIRATNQQTKCVSNLRGVSQGLQSYYNDFRVFPDDGYPDDANDLLPLSTELASYITTKSTYICPEDNDTTSTGNFASYDPYYVARKGSYDAYELAIGCPRHRGATNSTSLLSSGSTEITRVGTVLDKNLQEIPQDGTKAQRTISSVNDTMTFSDNSTVTISSAQAGYGVFLLQSVVLADGTVYSIIRVENDGDVDVQVNAGSKFEVVTPSAIVGVRGTQFTVTTTNLGFTTDVSLTEGTVTTLNRETGGTTTLSIGGTVNDTIAVTTHSHMHYHVDGTYHDHSHLALNNAHHGNPAVAKKAAAASTDADVDNDGDGYSENQGDCDDTNAAVYPGATDIPGNGIDEDCDGQDATGSGDDVDADGYTVAEGDCDDNDANVNPGKFEIPDNGIDDDCNYLTLDNTSDQAYVDYINDMGNSSVGTKNYLVANSPLSDDVLYAAIYRAPTPLNSAHMKDVLVANGPPLLEAITLTITNGAFQLHSNHTRDVLVNESPLNTTVLQASIDRNPQLNSAHYEDVFLANSPGLPQSILDQIIAGNPTMNEGHKQAVLDANP